MAARSRGFDAGLALRARVLDVLKAEGYIRDYSQIDFDNGKSEIEIELKYFDGAPVIREIARVSKPGRRVYVSVKSIPQVANGLGIVDPFDAEGRDGRSRGARTECRRRSPLPDLLIRQRSRNEQKRGRQQCLVLARNPFRCRRA